MSAPLIFIHFGNSSYLRYTLKSARLHNADKRIILLGDESNRHYGGRGIEYFDFSHFGEGPEIKLFDKIYRFIGGKQHRESQWVKFVFRRWFHLYYFLSAQRIERFWTFDSDTLVLCQLSRQEEKYVRYDCTEQCGGSCMNGLVNNLKAVKGYLDKINELFLREEYIFEQMKDFEVHPNYAFTEMRAYETYKKESGINRIHLGSVLDGEAFDDCLWKAGDFESFEKLPPGVGGSPKKVYLNGDGSLFCFHKPSQSFVKFNSLNMSWLPDYLFRRIIQHSKLQLRKKKPQKISRETLRVLDLDRNFSDILEASAVRICQRLRFMRQFDKNKGL
jgi:hypothetical protein